MTRMRDLMEADDGQGGELWNPAKGEYLIGEFLRYETRYSKTMSSDVKVALVREDETNKLWTIWLSREVLRSEFERKAPLEGNTIGVKYHGRKINGDGSEGYHRYWLEVDRSTGRTAPPDDAPADSAHATDKSDDDLDDLPF